MTAIIKQLVKQRSLKMPLICPLPITGPALAFSRLSMTFLSKFLPGHTGIPGHLQSLLTLWHLMTL